MRRQVIHSPIAGRMQRLLVRPPVHGGDHIAAPAAPLARGVNAAGARVAELSFGHG